MESSIFGEHRKLIRTPTEPDDEIGVLEIITSLSPTKEFKELLERERLLYKIINFNNTPCIIGYKNLDFYDKPRIAKSPGSGAIYLAKKKKPNEGYLLQLLPPNIRTSKHYHKYKKEVFYNLEGRCIIEVNDNKYLLGNNTYTVMPKVIHQLITEQEPALTLLEIRNDPKGLSMDDHWYVG